MRLWLIVGLLALIAVALGSIAYTLVWITTVGAVPVRVVLPVKVDR